jgi:hypothetical protein
VWWNSSHASPLTRTKSKLGQIAFALVFLTTQLNEYILFISTLSPNISLSILYIVLENDPSILKEVSSSTFTGKLLSEGAPDGIGN